MGRRDKRGLGRSALLTGRSNLIYGVLDQGFSSITNMAVGVAVATTSRPEVFGALGVVTALYLLEYGLVRGAISDPYTVAMHDADDDAMPQAISASVAFSLAFLVFHVVLAGLLGGPTKDFMLAYAVLTPGLTVQVAVRGLLIAHGRSRQALESNVFWAAVQLGLSVPAALADSSVGLFVAWGVGGWASAIYCLVSLGHSVRLSRWRAWFRGRERLAFSWASDYVAQQGTAQILVWTMGLVAGLREVAAYRGALLFAGPATVVVGGLVLVLLPAASARARRADRSLDGFILKLTLLFVSLTLVLLVPFALIPDSLGRRILGGSWEGTQAVLLLMIALRMVTAATTAVAVGLRAVQEHRITLRLRMIAGVATLLGATIAAALWGAMGAYAMLLAVTVALLPAWYLTLRAQTSKPRHARAPSSPEVGDLSAGELDAEHRPSHLAPKSFIRRGPTPRHLARRR